MFDDNYPDTDWLMADLSLHGSHPYMNLFEGNIGNHISPDYTHGSSSVNTFFRNYVDMESQGEGADISLHLVGADIQKYNRYINLIGNVFGKSGYTGTYEAENISCNQREKYVFRLGYESDGDCEAADNDPLVKETLLRHANFDYITNSVKYCDDPGEIGCQGGDGSHTLPSSLYLSSKPSWFGSLSWPAIGPDVNPKAGIIPAKQRFDALMAGETPEVDTTPPSTPTNLSATVVSSSQINLSWTASTDNIAVVGYRIYRAGTQIATTAATSYSDTGLTASTTYTYTVAAYDAASNVSNQSSSTSAATKAASSSGQTGSTGGGSNIPTTPSTPTTPTNPTAPTTPNVPTTPTTSSGSNFNSSPSSNLLRAASETKVYEIISNFKHWIPSPQVFNAYGFSWQKIQITNSSEINKYSRVKLLRAQGDTKVYYLTESGQIRHIPNPEIFNSYNNNWDEILTVSQTEIDSYPISNLIRLENGTKVYKLENGTKRWITTAEVFNRLEYDWSKIAPADQTELNYYPEGEVIK